MIIIISLLIIQLLINSFNMHLEFTRSNQEMISMQKLNTISMNQTKSATRLEVTIQNGSRKQLFQVDGAFPSFISSINYGKSLTP